MPERGVGCAALLAPNAMDSAEGEVRGKRGTGGRTARDPSSDRSPPSLPPLLPDFGDPPSFPRILLSDIVLILKYLKILLPHILKSNFADLFLSEG